MTYETELIGKLLLHPSEVGKLAGHLLPEDFTEPLAGDVYRRLVKLRTAGELPIEASHTVLALADVMRDNVHTIMAWADSCGPLRENIVPIARRILRDSQRAFAADQQLVGTVDDIQGSISDVTAQLRRDIPTPKSSRQAIDELAEEIASGSYVSANCFFGLRRLDEFYSGLLPGELHILAARPGMGKTTFALQAAMYQTRKNRGSLFVSCEMTPQQLVMRWAAGSAGFDYRHVRRGNLTDAERLKLSQTLLTFPHDQFSILESRQSTVSDIREFCIKSIEECPRHLLVVDYLNLLAPSDKRMDRHLQIQDITASLKALAGDLKIPVLALAQLNRQGTDEPQLSHLRESGAIEQDADVVGFIWQQGDHTLFKIAKHRYGETCSVHLHFDKAAGRFYDQFEYDQEGVDPF